MRIPAEGNYMQLEFSASTISSEESSRWRVSGSLISDESTSRWIVVDAEKAQESLFRSFRVKKSYGEPEHQQRST